MIDLGEAGDEGLVNVFFIIIFSRSLTHLALDILQVPNSLKKVRIDDWSGHIAAQKINKIKWFMVKIYIV